jgi:serine/threonine-protein kinase
MATVFLARLSGVAGFQRLVAIKRLHPHLAREPEFIEMFLDEARLAARIHHPNVVPIQEVGESERGYYLVMDYVEGDTLARLLARASQVKQTIPHSVIIRVLLDVLAGLHAAHELKDDLGQPLDIVHRDVSPQNVIVGVDGVARLVDFGVARAASRLATTRSGQLKGKLSYMAPEQARGATIDRRADLFSCGIVLWESLAMKRLFKGEGEAETLNRVLYDPIPSPSSVRSDVPRTLETICMKALEREADKRYATALEFADALERAAQALSCVGSVRDVASCLDNVVGTEITQQREAVRAWLARSEPSAISKRPLIPPNPDSVTRIEGGSKSSPSKPAPEPVDRGAATIVERTPDKVSSVSSAVLQVKDPGPPSSHAAPPSKSRTGLVVAAIVAAAVLGGAAVWGATHVGVAKPAATTTTTPSATASETAAAAASAPPSATPTTTATASATATETASAVASARPARPPFKPGTARPPASAKPRPTGTSVPDDLGNNPYR